VKKTILLSIFTLWVCALASAQGLELIDDAVQGSKFYRQNYVGTGWEHGSITTTFYNSTLSFFSVTEEYLTFTFFASIKIQWYTEKKSTYGITGVSIDGGAEKLIELYAATKQHVLVYSSPVLSRGTHTIKQG
jgi:hypothetical protein